MIYHICRAAWKPEATSEDVEAILESWRNQGRTISAIKSHVVGRDFGGDYTHGATFVLEDLDGLFAYLTHPTTYETDGLGLHLVERLDIFDISDDGDPNLNSKIQELHRRRNAHNPEVAAKLADVPTYQGAGIED